MIKRLYSDHELDIFPVYAITASDSDNGYLQEAIDRPEGFSLHQIFLVKKGRCDFSVRGKHFILDVGDLFFLAANVPHSYKGLDNDFTTCYLGFAGIGCQTVLDYYHIEEFGVYKQKNYGKFLTHLANTIMLMKTSDTIPAICASAYASVIAFFDAAIKTKYTPIEKVYNYLKNNYSSPLTLDELLKIYPYSKTKLCQDFAATYGMTIFEMLTQIRLQSAHELLLMDPNMKLKTIINICGFNDMSYFCKMYKRKYNISPKSSIASASTKNPLNNQKKGENKNEKTKNN